MLVCAAPSYVGQHGLPTTLADLPMHACIDQRLPNGRLQSWEFRVDGKAHSVVPSSDLVFNDPDLVLQAACDGHGLAQLPAYQVREALRDGALVTCLDAFAPDDRGHYLCYLSRRQQPKRIRAFIDFMTAQIRALDVDVMSHWEPSRQAVGPTRHVAGMQAAA
jgi:DNA-binding transcriptional LysR family regulator